MSMVDLAPERFPFAVDEFVNTQEFYVKTQSAFMDGKNLEASTYLKPHTTLNPNPNFIPRPNSSPNPKSNSKPSPRPQILNPKP